MAVRRLYLWACCRLYNEVAWAYDPVSWLVSLGRWSGWRQTVLDYVKGPRVLEVGFGTGELLPLLASHHPQVCGLELSAAMHRITAAKLRRRPAPVWQVRAPVQAAPFADGIFDSVISTFPGEYIVDPATHHEVARLLRPPQVDGGEGGRWLMLDIAVQTRSRLAASALQWLYGTPADSYLDRCGALAAAAGLGLQTHVHAAGRTQVWVTVAEKLA